MLIWDDDIHDAVVLGQNEVPELRGVKKEKQHLVRHFVRNQAVENSRKEHSSVTSMLTDDESVPKKHESENYESLSCSMVSAFSADA